MIEALGYLGSLLILISLTRTSILQLRIIGLAGSLSFFVYGLLIAAYPIAIVNVAIVGVHIYFLRQLMSKKEEFFSSLELSMQSAYLRHFLSVHASDIENFQPGFSFTAREDQIRAFILRGTVPAGVFIGRVCPDASVEVELDYVVPEFRDFKVANFLYSDRSGVFEDRGRRRIWTVPGNPAYVDYFERLGFHHALLDGRPVLISDLDNVLETDART